MSTLSPCDLPPIHCAKRLSYCDLPTAAGATDAVLRVDVGNDHTLLVKPRNTSLWMRIRRESVFLPSIASHPPGTAERLADLLLRNTVPSLLPAASVPCRTGSPASISLRDMQIADREPTLYALFYPYLPPARRGPVAITTRSWPSSMRKNHSHYPELGARAGAIPQATPHRARRSCPRGTFLTSTGIGQHHFADALQGGLWSSSLLLFGLAPLCYQA